MSDTKKRVIMFILFPFLIVLGLFVFIYSWTEIYDGPSQNIENSKENTIFIQEFITETTIPAKFIAWKEKRSITTERYCLGFRISKTVTTQPGERVCIRISNHNAKGVYYIVDPLYKKVGSFNLVSSFDIDNTFIIPHVFQVYETNRKESVGTVQITDFSASK